MSAQSRTSVRVHVRPTHKCTADAGWHGPERMHARAQPCRSVPSGRVGSASDCVFATHETFRERLVEREAQDVAELESKMARR